MKRFIALALCVFAAMFVLVGCGPKSTAGVKVVGDNVARLPAGDTMILRRNGKGSFDWVITYDGNSKVHFYRKQFLGDDNVDITVSSVGEEAKFDPGWMELDMWVSRQSDHAVNVRWEDGLVFQSP